MASTNCFCYYWKNTEVFEGSKKVSEMRMYCVNEDGKSTCIRVNNICSKVVLDFGYNFDLEKNLGDVLSILNFHVYNTRDRNSIKFVKKHRLYWFVPEENGVERKKYPFIEISFSSQGRLFYFLKKIPEMNFPVEPKVHEINASPEIQFIVKQNLFACGWVTVLNGKTLIDNDKQTFCDYEFCVDPDQLVSCDLNANPTMTLMAWDIEAKCNDISNTPGEHVDDCVFQISCVFSTTTEAKGAKKILLTLGECDEIPNVEIRRFEEERDLIIGFAKLIREKRPTILTGWNLFNFDIKFMVKRAEHNQCLGEFLDFSLVNSETDLSQNNNPSKILNVKWASKAMLTTNVVYIDAEGILTIDLIELVRKEYKFDSYSLNAVSREFLKEEKFDITLADILYAYRAYKENLPDAKRAMTLVGDYCVQDSNLVVEIFHKIQAWIGLVEMARTTNTPVMTVHLYGQQKRYFNQIYKYCYENDIVVEFDAYQSSANESYTGAYVFDPVPSMYEYVVSLDFNSLYPSIIIAYNIDYTSLIHKDYVDEVPKHMIEHMQWEDHIACEHDNACIKKKVLSDTITMYESQISFLKKKPDQHKNLLAEATKKLKDFRSQRATIDKKISKRRICQKNSFFFVKKEFQRGVVPTIIKNLLNQRKLVRAQMKSETDEMLVSLLNKRQLSLKIAANSMYGAMGVRRGALPFMPLAMCVTHTGRESIKRAAEILKGLGGNIIYGDTDSSYVIFDDIKGTHNDKCEKIWTKAIESAKEISSNFPDPMNIEFEEEIYYKYLILTKKRYMYLPCNRDGVVTSKIKHKGVLLSRRDNSKFMKNVYEECVMMIFDGKSKFDVGKKFNDMILDLISGSSDCNCETLKITKSVNDYNSCKITYDEQIGKYKMGAYIVPNPDSFENEDERVNFCKRRLPAQVQLEIKMVENGEEKAEGSRIEYIFVKNPVAQKQCDKIVNYKKFLNSRENLNVDYLYYVQRLVEPLEQLFLAVWNDSKTVNSVYKQHANKFDVCKSVRKLFSPKFKIAVVPPSKQ